MNRSGCVARFFVDENFAAVGRAMTAVRKDVISAADVRGKYPRFDEDWIPMVAGEGLVVITNDRHIRTRYVEAQAAVEAGLRCAQIRVTGRKNPTAWEHLRLIGRHWEAIERLQPRDGPVWLAVTSGGTHELEYSTRPAPPPPT